MESTVAPHRYTHRMSRVPVLLYQYCTSTWYCTAQTSTVRKKQDESDDGGPYRGNTVERSVAVGHSMMMMEYHVFTTIEFIDDNGNTLRLIPLDSF